MNSNINNNNNKKNNNKSNIYSITDPILIKLLMECFWDKQQQKNNSNKYISAITDPCWTKLEMITITTETTLITTKTKTTTHSTTKNNKSQLLMTWIGPSFKARFLVHLHLIWKRMVWIVSCSFMFGLIWSFWVFSTTKVVWEAQWGICSALCVLCQ